MKTLPLQTGSFDSSLPALMFLILLTFLLQPAVAVAQQLQLNDSSELLPAATSPLQGQAAGRPWYGPTWSSSRNIQLTVSAALSGADAIAGYASTQDTADNQLTLSSGSKIHSAMAGLSQGRYSAQYNEAFAAAGAQAQLLAGAVSLENGRVRVNRVESAARTHYLAGGISSKGRADSNEAILLAGAYSEFACGGLGASGSESNELSINADAAASQAAGGLSLQGKASYNFLTVAGKVGQAAAGFGYSGTDSNFLELSGTADRAAGGISAQGGALYNSVTLHPGAKAGQLYGAQAQLLAAGNSVTLMEHSSAGSVQGGISNSADSIENSVTVSGTIGSSGSSAVVLKGGEALQGSAYLNQVHITKAANVYGNVQAGYGAKDALYNNLTIEGQVTGDISAGTAGNEASLNLLFIRAGNVSGNVTAAQGLKALHNTLLLVNAKVSGDASAATAMEAAHNLTVLRGLTEVEGTVFGARDVNGQPVNQGNEIAVDGTVKAGALDGFHRLHLLIDTENDSAGAQPVLTVTGKNGLDLSGRELWVSGIKVDAPDQVKLLYVNEANKLTVDEHTLIRGDESFVFHAWQPRSEHVFEHELIWSAADSSQDPVFDHTLRLDADNARTLLTAPAAAALSLLQGSKLIDNLSLPNISRGQAEPFAAVSYFDIEFDQDSRLELDGFSAAGGIAFALNQEGSLNGLLFATGGSSSYQEDFTNCSPSGDISWAGAGARLALQEDLADLELTVQGGITEGDFSAFYRHSEEQVSYDFRAPYAALGLQGNLHFRPTRSLTLSPGLFYQLLHLDADSLTLSHQDDNLLELKGVKLQNAGIKLGLTASPLASLSLSADLFYSRFLDSQASGSIEGFTLPDYQLKGHACGAQGGLKLHTANLSVQALLRRSGGDIRETAGQLQLKLRF